MKFSWGTGIALVYVVFATFLIGMLIRSHHYDPGLVEQDYYNLDLNYQARLEKKQNAGQMAVSPTVQFDADAKSVQVTFPADMPQATGTAKCYRSATTQEDFSTSIEHSNSLRIPADKLTPGRWHIELDWEANGKPYFYETTFIVPNA
jgi:nitrogen fixation protein FixH